jgi:MFS family permease
MAPPKHRGALNILFQFAITIGILVANIINWLTASHVHGWRYSLGLAVVPAIMLISGSLFLPDTPNSLIERGEKEKGKAILRKIRGVENVDVEYDEIVETSNLANQVCFRFTTHFVYLVLNL